MPFAQKIYPPATCQHKHGQFLSLVFLSEIRYFTEIQGAPLLLPVLPYLSLPPQGCDNDDQSGAPSRTSTQAIPAACAA